MPALLKSPQPVLDEVRARLAMSSHLFLRHVNCRIKGDRLRLTGLVPSFYLKQLAQTVAQQVEGVRTIENQLKVANPRGVSE